MNNVGNKQHFAFVTGGSGFVGGRLIEALVAHGWQVRALVRGKRAAASVTALGAVPVLGELTDQAALSQAMAGSKVVFHVAALFKMWGKQKEFNAVNVDGTRALVEAAVATPSVEKVIMVSAGAVVQGDPVPLVNIDESVPVQQRSFAPYSASKAAAEQILLAANGRRAGFQTVAIRPPNNLGRGHAHARSDGGSGESRQLAVAGCRNPGHIDRSRRQSRRRAPAGGGSGPGRLLCGGC